MTDISHPERKGALAAYVAVTAAYWAFMLTDGALRMLVLLHFNSLGFSPIQLAYLFLLYEFMGMVTNLAAGWIAARFGLTATLYAGLGIQIGALLALSFLDPGWTIAGSVVFVMAVQGASGVAKDLAKMLEQADQNPGHGFVQHYEDGKGNTVLAVTYWKLAKTPKKPKPKPRPVAAPDPNAEDHTDDLYFKSGRTKKSRRRRHVDPNQMDLFGEKAKDQ